MRQTLFAEFEYEVHRMQQDEEPLTVDALKARSTPRSMRNTTRVWRICRSTRSNGRASRIFIGRSTYTSMRRGTQAPVAIADRILRTNDASDYLAFLSMGGSDYPLAELKRAGVDLESPAPVNDALTVFDQTIDQLRALLEEIA